MATSTIDTDAREQWVGFPSRLVPGAQSSNAPIRRKASSAWVDGRAWDRNEREKSTRQPLFSALLEAILPQPSTRSQRSHLIVAVLADFLAILGSYAVINLCLVLAQHGTYLSQFRFPPPPVSGSSLALLYGIVFTLLGYSERLYQAETIQAPQQERRILIKTSAWSAVLLVLVFLGSSTNQFPVMRLAASAPFSLLLMIAWRRLMRDRSEPHQSGASSLRNVLIVGAGELGRKLATRLKLEHSRERTVQGFLDDNEPMLGDVRGRIGDLSRIARQYFVDEIILTIPPETDAAKQVIWEARRNRIDVKFVPSLFGFDPQEITLERFDDIPVLTLCEERIPAVGLLLKRTIDVVFSAFALVLTAPCFCLIAIAIKLDSRGPVFYRATRLGRKGQRFLCCKFRTMVADADARKDELRACNERQGAFFKITDDPRVTRVGRILRRYSLDELPQLWNVLRGEMSLVGPRPHPVDDFERYQLEDWQRLEITPGLTGLWQVTARSDPSFERGMALDREYIGAWNLWLDFKILCRTVMVVLRGEGV